MTGKRGCFDAGFDAKFESFFCHEPRSSSPDGTLFFSGWGRDSLTATGRGDGADGDGSFRSWSDAFFFFEALLWRVAESQREQQELSE